MIIDLSVLLSREMPCTWPGHVPYAHQNWNWYTGARGPYSTHFIMIDEHCGTHMDAPTHCSGAGKPGQSPFIEPSDLLAHENSRGGFRPGDAVLLRTGWDRYYVAGPDGRRFADEPLVTSAAPGWPAPSVDAMLLLHERGVRLVGIDSPSMGAAHDGVPVHLEGLSRGMLYVEMLTNLGSVPRSGGTFLFLPLRIEGGTGGPGRAIVMTLPAERIIAPARAARGGTVAAGNERRAGSVSRRGPSCLVRLSSMPALSPRHGG